MDRLLQMILNRFLGQLINKGINAGITHVANKGKAPEEMTPQDREQANFARKAGRRARQAASIARKLMR
jgi:hypothetical protein